MASLVEAQGLGARRARSAGGPIRRRARDNRLGRCVPCLGGVLRRRAPYPLARFSVPTDRQNSAPQPPLRGTRHQLPTVLPRRRPLTRRLPAGRALPEEGRTPHRRQRPLCARRRRAGRQIPHLPFMAYGHSFRRGRARVDGNELPQGLDVHGQVVADLTLDAMKIQRHVRLHGARERCRPAHRARSALPPLWSANRARRSFQELARGTPAPIGPMPRTSRVLRPRRIHGTPWRPGQHRG